MATGQKEVGWNLVTVGNLKPENPDKIPYYISIVICQNKIIVLDYDDRKVKIHRLHDGKFLDKLDSNSTARAICLMDATTICVLHYDGLIEMASIKSENMSPVFTRMKSFRLDGVFDRYESVVRVNDNIVVVGVKQDTTYWCITSLDDGHVDTIHRICKESIWSSVTTKDNIIYISCSAGVDHDDTGVYGFDILNPSQCKYKYKHQLLDRPRSIVINEDGNIFVGDYGGFLGGYPCIHQLTASCQLVAIFTPQGIPWSLQAMFWDNGRLYVTCYRSHDITVFRHVYQGSHKASEDLASHERKQLGIVEFAIQIAKGNVDNGQSSVETEIPPSRTSPEDSEDEKQENNTDSEVPINNEGKELVIEGTTAQIGHEIVDNGQSSVDTQRPSSGPIPDNSEDDTQDNHTDSEVPISNEGKELVIEGTTAQIGHEIVDNGQSSVDTQRPSSGPIPDNSEDDTQENHTDSEVPISNEGKELVIEGTTAQIGHEIVDNGQSSVDTQRPSSGPIPDNSEDDTQGNHRDLEVPISDEGKQPVIELTSTQIGQEIPIERSVEEELNQAGIKMSTEELDLFIKFQNEIGTDIYFRKGPHRSNDGHNTIKATETLFEQNHPDMKDKWLEYKSQGKLTLELIDVIFAQERNQELHENKDDFLNKMEQLNIIVKAKVFNENGVKEENYFFTPCMLHTESPREVFAPENDARIASTSVLCWVIKGKLMLHEIFQKLTAACLARWPVAKKKNTSKSLIFKNCTVFDLDPVHRLVLHCENHAVFARITSMGIDHVNAKMCTRVRKFITLNLSHQDPNLKYQLCVQNFESQDFPENIGSRFSPPFEMWFVDEVHDPAAPITREHMNHARLCLAIVAICGNAMRSILLANPPAPHTDIVQAILANKTILISKTKDGSGKWRKALLNKDQRKVLFPDPKRQDVASIDQFDISLLYILIRNITTVKPLSTDWGFAPQDRPRDKSLGANVERIHLYRNEIVGHSVDGQISQAKFDDYWKKIDSVLHDIDVIVDRSFSQELEKQRRQVISVYEAC